MSDDCLSDNSLQDPGLFDGQTAWFSTSVQCNRQKAWTDGDGQIADLDCAMFVFSEDASCCDTASIYESAPYLSDSLAVFHASYIDECIEKQNLEQVTLGKYFLPPTSLQPAIKKQHHFHWETRSRNQRPCKTHTERTTPKKRHSEISESGPSGPSSAASNLRTKQLFVSLSAYIPLEALTPAQGDLEEFIANQNGCTIKLKGVGK